MKLNPRRYISTFIIFIAIGWGIPEVGLSTADTSQLFLQTYHETLGDLLYDRRDIPGNLKESLKAYQTSRKDKRSLKEVYWKISRSYWMLARRRSNPAKKNRYFQKAYQSGKNAVRTNDKNSKSHLWRGLSLGSLALESGVMKKISTKDEIKKSLQKTLQLNTNEIEALLGLASWYFHVPDFFGGNRKQAYQLIEKAIQIDPNFTANLKLKADFLIQEKRYAEARIVLLQLLGTQMPTSTFGGIEDKALAREILKFISTKIS